MMFLTCLSIIIYQCWTGVVEGLKNRWSTLPVLWWSKDGSYHEWRLMQGVFIIFAVIFGMFAGFTWLHVAALVCSWIGGNAIYNRFLVWVAQAKHSLLDINRNVDGTPASFCFGKLILKQYPIFTTGWTELVFTFPIFTIFAIILAIV